MKLGIDGFEPFHVSHHSSTKIPKSAGNTELSRVLLPYNFISDYKRL